MFKIEKTEMINKTFRLSANLVKELQKVAQEENISLNNLVKQCCEYALKNLKDIKPGESSLNSYLYKIAYFEIACSKCVRYRTIPIYKVECL